MITSGDTRAGSPEEVSYYAKGDVVNFRSTVLHTGTGKTLSLTSQSPRPSVHIQTHSIST